MVISQFPQELCDRQQWVLWRYETRDGKRTKVPYQANGRRASSTDSSTWVSSGAACAALASGTFSGIGFVFSGTDGVVGVDLDHVIDPDTGEIDERACDIIAELDSYTEFSPSGTGVHIYGRATLPAGMRRKAGGIECYDSGRYFTVTGRQFPGTFDTIADWDGEQLQTLLFGDLAPVRTQIVLPVYRPVSSTYRDDRDILDRAMDAANGARFRSLWRGSREGYGSPSEADSALCFHLAFWTNRDATRMDALFRQSGLMRDKWTRKIRESSDETYGDLTIRKAIAKTAEGFASSARRVG